MTIRYANELATVSLSGFHKLLLRWTGSLYKLMWKEFLAYMTLFYGIALFYQYGLSTEHQKVFRDFGAYLEARINQVQVTFVYGIYLVDVGDRYWEMSQLVVGPGKLSIMLTVCLDGTDEKSRLMRRSIVRYISLGAVLTLRSISVPVRTRFPTIKHIVDAGFMTENEMTVFESIKSRYSLYYVPFIWATAVVARARKEERMKYDTQANDLRNEMKSIIGSCEMLFRYDYVNIPIIYTQIAALTVTIWLGIALISRQYTNELWLHGDFYVPFFTILQLVFYVGLMKLAEQMLNPFGSDDDDVDLNGMIDGMLRSAFQIVDGTYVDLPEMERDKHWGLVTFKVPYTIASKRTRRISLLGTADRIVVPHADLLFAPTQHTSKSKVIKRSASQSKKTGILRRPKVEPQ